MEAAMWKVEARETMRQVLLISMLFAFVPALYLLDAVVYRSGVTFIEYISNGFELLILAASASLAYNMFHREDRDGAMEYLLSIPGGRWRILAAKVLPRVVAILPLLAAGTVLNTVRLNQGSALGMTIIDWRAGLLYLWGFAAFVQLGGFAMGVAGRRSWPVALSLLLMAFCVWRFCTPTLLFERFVFWTMGLKAQIHFSFWMARNGGRYLDLAVFFALMLSILRPLLRTWDLRPRKEAEKLFLRRASLPLAVFCLLLLNRFVGHIRPIFL